ncbi:MAG: hypothetical protein ACHQ1F_12140 [Spirochaetia bacterium]
MSIGALWVIFSLSFLLSLSGALMPGPLLTYTIVRTLRTAEKGWLTGARVIAGHAALECVLIFGLVLGVMGFLRAPAAAKIIGVGGSGPAPLHGNRAAPRDRARQRHRSHCR